LPEKIRDKTAGGVGVQASVRFGAGDEIHRSTAGDVDAIRVLEGRRATELAVGAEAFLPVLRVRNLAEVGDDFIHRAVADRKPVVAEVRVDRVRLQIQVRAKDPWVRNKVAPVGAPSNPDSGNQVRVRRRVLESLEDLHCKLHAALVVGHVRPVQRN
jgi:hypothetical protein